MKTKSLVVAMVAAVLMLGPAARAAGPAFVTLSFGRAQWAPAEKCQPITGAVDLGQVADALAARGLAGNAVVITSYTDETTRKCKGGIARQASWADLEGLADRGWSVADGGTHNVAVDSMTYDEAYAEICGSILMFTSHGLDPTGMWAWAGGNKHYSDAYQRQIVATCFDWGRLYGLKANTTAIVSPPYTQKTWSLNGGWCAQGSGSCFTTARQNGANHGYQVPSRFLTFLSAKPDTWAVLQGYRFVTGPMPRARRPGTARPRIRTSTGRTATSCTAGWTTSQSWTRSRRRGERVTSGGRRRLGACHRMRPPAACPSW